MNIWTKRDNKKLMHSFYKMINIIQFNKVLDIKSTENNASAW